MQTRRLIVGVVLLAAVTLGLPALALGEPITVPVAFTVSGHGGLSGPIENFHNDAFWWAGINGGVSTTALDAVGFSLPSPPAYLQLAGSGSILLSAPLAVQDGETLSVSFRVFAGMAHFFMEGAVGFAVVLEDGQLHSVLAVTRPDGAILCDIDVCHAPGVPFATPSPGVVTTMITTPAPHFTLDGRTYNDPNVSMSTNTTCGGAPCLTTITSLLTPGAGVYQVLAGVYGQTGSLITPGVGVAVTEVTVPEVNVLTLLGLGFVGFMLAKRTRHAAPRVSPTSGNL